MTRNRMQPQSRRRTSVALVATSMSGGTLTPWCIAGGEQSGFIVILRCRRPIKNATTNVHANIEKPQVGTCTHRPPPAATVPVAAGAAVAAGVDVSAVPLCSLDERFSFRFPLPLLVFSCVGLSLLFLLFSAERSGFGRAPSTDRYPLCPPFRAYATPSEKRPCSSTQYLACGKAWMPVVPPVREL
jgi:hypothetical protein